MSVLLPGQLRAEYAPRGVCRGVYWGSEGVGGGLALALWDLASHGRATRKGLQLLY